MSTAATSCRLRRVALLALVAPLAVVAACGTADDVRTGGAPAGAPGVAAQPRLTPYPPQPAGVPYPDAEWPVGTLPPEVSLLALDAATEQAFEPSDSEQGVRSIVVIRGGQLVYERYHPLDGPDERYSSFSVAKSFTSALVGLAVGDGLLTEGQTALRAEWQGAGDRRAGIELRDLLQMSSGLEWDESYTAPSDVLTMITSADAAAFVAAKPLESEPGTVYEYSTGTTALLVGIVADRLDGCAESTEYVNERLLDPIGITTDELLLDDAGCWLGGLGANMTTRDFARFGLLYLRGGQWDGTQLLAESWVDASRTPAPTNEGYGYQWWLNGDNDRFTARGLLGQLIVVVPSLDVTIAVNSAGGDPDGLVETVLAELRFPTGPDPAVTTTTTPPAPTTTTTGPVGSSGTLPAVL